MRTFLVRSATAAGLVHAVALAGLLGLCAAATASGQASPADDPPLRVAIVQLDVVAIQSPAGQELQARLLDFQEEVTAEMQALQAAARSIEQRVAEADSLSGDARRALEREYQDAVTNFQRFQQDKQEEANQMRAEGLAEIQQQIAPVIEALQAEYGYDLVLNAQNDLIVLFSDRIDITEAVLERLQGDAGAGS